MPMGDLLLVLFTTSAQKNENFNNYKVFICIKYFKKESFKLYNTILFGAKLNKHKRYIEPMKL